MDPSEAIALQVHQSIVKCSGEFILGEPSDRHVLLGRGRSHTQHPGNIWFRREFLLDILLFPRRQQHATVRLCLCYGADTLFHFLLG